jgi:hypothetical protein
VNIPQLPNIVDLVALQNAVALVLLSDDRLATIPILTEIKLHMDNQIAVDALWTLPRSAIQVKPGTIDLFAVPVDGDLPTVPGPTGAGLLVEMPEAKSVSNNLTGPPLDWQIRIVCFEERNINLTAGVGTFIMAEQLAQIVLDILQLQYIYPFGSFKVSKNAVGPARDWETIKDGLVCWACTVEVHNGRVQTPRSAVCALSFNSGLCTITCPDVAAEVRFTTDGTPATRSNPGTQVYAAPFAVAKGTIVQVSSWKQGNLTSSITGATAP